MDVENKLSLIRYKKELKLLNQSILKKDVKSIQQNKKKSKLNEISKINDSKISRSKSNLDKIDLKKNGLNNSNNININISKDQEFQKQDFSQYNVVPELDSKDFTSNSNLEIDQNSKLFSCTEITSSLEQDSGLGSGSGSGSALEIGITRKTESISGKEQAISESKYSSLDSGSISISDTTLEQISKEKLESNLIIKNDQHIDLFENHDIDNKQPPNNMEAINTQEELN